MGVKIEGLVEVQRVLRALPGELVRDRSAIREALRKASAVIQKQEKDNLQDIINKPNIGPDLSTGILSKNIVLGDGRKAPNRVRVVIKIANRRYPKIRGKNLTTQQIARLLEYGTVKRRPYSFIRTALKAKQSQAIGIFFVEMERTVPLVVARLARRFGAKQ